MISPESLKLYRHQTVQVLIQAITNLPHKAFVYGTLISMINLVSPSLAHEIVSHLIEQLQLSLVQERNIHASKNQMRLLAVLAEYGSLSSGWYSQTVL